MRMTEVTKGMIKEIKDTLETRMDKKTVCPCGYVM